jgi:antirestriction protein ArdC
MKIDIRQQTTNELIALLETEGSNWTKPWTGGSPDYNVSSGKPYRGINVFLLGMAAHGAPQWGTFRQWQAKGARIRKGEKATHIVFYKTFDKEVDGVTEHYRIARGYAVFNADQVDGYQAPVRKVQTPCERDATADRFVANTGARIEHGGGRAYYVPSQDMIQMPVREDFVGSETSTPTEAYYSTLLHELTHWTGEKSRCDRDLAKRFGSSEYAAEELIAESGAAMLCAILGISPEPRVDHAQYINGWLKALKNDKSIAMKSFAAAQRAVSYLEGLQEQEELQEVA